MERETADDLRYIGVSEVDIARSIPIIIYAYTCHTQVLRYPPPLIESTIHNYSHHSPSPSSLLLYIVPPSLPSHTSAQAIPVYAELRESTSGAMFRVICGGVFLSFFLYFTTGIFGYLTFGSMLHPLSPSPSPPLPLPLSLSPSLLLSSSLLLSPSPPLPLPLSPSLPLPLFCLI